MQLLLTREQLRERERESERERERDVRSNEGKKSFLCVCVSSHGHLHKYKPGFLLNQSQSNAEAFSAWCSVKFNEFVHVYQFGFYVSRFTPSPQVRARIGLVKHFVQREANTILGCVPDHFGNSRTYIDFKASLFICC